VVGVLLGLVVASAFGSGDFIGGRASQSAPAVTVLLVVEASSVVGAVAVALVVHAHVAPHDLGFGAAAGAVNAIGLGLLYDALARHPAGVVAPLAAVVGAIVPVTWGLVTGERPSVVVLIGCVTAIVAAGIIAKEPGPVTSSGVTRGAGQAIAAGFAFGSSLVFLAHASGRSGQWPVVAARASAFVVVAVAAIVLASTRGGVRLPRGNARWLALSAGVLDVAATATLLIALRRALLVIVAPFAALAPGFTVLLAWLVNGERLRPLQRAGFVVALAALVLVAIG
jgi:drug/metabolite transporter (DMT)-like permease